MTATIFCAFLRRLLHGMTCKIVLIVDGHPVHTAKRVQQFVAQQAGQVELHFLPPYSPDLTPDELAWAHVKTKTGARGRPYESRVEDTSAWDSTQSATSASSCPPVLSRALLRVSCRMRLYSPGLVTQPGNCVMLNITQVYLFGCCI